jgi:hypothetical protein
MVVRRAYKRVEVNSLDTNSLVADWNSKSPWSRQSLMETQCEWRSTGLLECRSDPQGLWLESQGSQ